MRRLGILGVLATSLVGCHQAAPMVYVDLDKVPVDRPKTIKSIDIEAASAPPKVNKSVTIDPQAERVVRVDREHSASAIRDLLRAESEEARKVISERLRQYYQAEIDEFFDSEYEKLGPTAQGAWKEYRDKIRPIFEQYGKERGPLVVSLTVYTEFPNPETLVKIDPDSDPALETRAEKTRDLQRKILVLDQKYEADIAKLDSDARGVITASEESMNERVEAKRKEINERAEREARQQVNVRTDVMNERLAGMGASTLAARKGESLSVELGAADSGFKGVPSTSRQIVPPADAHRQLQMWLALNGYDLADSPVGVRDATQDFIKWRASLTSTR